MKEEVAKKWIEELRSGNHIQGRHQLCNSDGEMCCLGVLAKVVLGAKIVGNRKILNQEEQILAGMKSPFGQLLNGLTLINMNDGGKTFTQIANVIEKNWEQI